jgi:hypothetical protein
MHPLLSAKLKRPLPKLADPNRFIFDRLTEHRDAAFIQCGANGVGQDDLQNRIVESGIRAILIEPHPYYAKVLNYRYNGYANVEVINNTQTQKPRLMLPDLVRAGHVENVSQIKHLDGHHRRTAALQVGLG